MLREEGSNFILKGPPNFLSLDLATKNDRRLARRLFF